MNLPSSLKLRNTYTKALEAFEPLDGKCVTLYSCGPTVYSYAHIGNFRSFLLGDMIRRVLEQRGYAVRHVMNITDVGHMTEDHLADATGEDKLARAARELGWDPYKVAAHFERAFVEDAKALRLKNYLGEEAVTEAIHPRATQHVAEMLAMIQRLLERKYAYVDSEGQVYFAVSAFADYGRLSGKVLDDLEVGSRVAVRGEKNDPRDFALWKVDAKHLMQWDPHSPEGWPPSGWQRLQSLVPGGVDPRVRAGFPGWHIECSAMVRAALGAVIDIHTGGEDNVFPHHECEIAQSYGARMTDDAPSSFARYWVHARHLLVNGVKMSKRDGTFMTARDLFDPKAAQRDDLLTQLVPLGFAEGRVPPAVLRFALLATPFTQPMNFTLDVLVQARSTVERIQSLYDRLGNENPPAVGLAGLDGGVSPEMAALLQSANAGFDAALNDNINTPRAIAEVFRVVAAGNQSELTGANAAAVRRFLERVDGIFDVLDRRARSGLLLSEELMALADGLTGSEALPDRQPVDDATVRSALAQRFLARRARNFTRADEIRNWLQARGVDAEDTGKGVRWRFR